MALYEVLRHSRTAIEKLDGFYAIVEDADIYTDASIAEALGLSRETVNRLRRRR